MIVDAIYNVDPEGEVFEEYCVAWITFQGKKYHGKSFIHHDDQDFFSEKVGLNIALSRARLAALKDKYNEAKIEAKYKNRMFLEATNYSGDGSKVDPTGAFKAKVDKANKRVRRLAKLSKKKKYPQTAI